MTIDQAMQMGVEHHQAGRLAEAEAVYRQVLALQPQNVSAIYLLGMLALNVQKYDLAEPLLRQAMSLAPNEPKIYNELGNALHGLHRHAEAILMFLEALRLQPVYPTAVYNLANAYRDNDQVEDSIRSYKLAIEQNPDDIAAMNNLAELLIYRRQLNAARECYEHALQVDPKFAATHVNYGNILWTLGEKEPALAEWKLASELDPNLAEPYHSVGNVFLESGDIDQAINCFEKSLARKPNYSESYNSLGTACKESGELDLAIECFRKSLEYKPTFRHAFSNLALTILYHPGFDSKRIFEETCNANQFYKSPPSSPPKRPNADRLRIGYVSPDFRSHPVGRFMLPLIAAHDARAVEIVCYSDAKPDDMTRRFQSHAHHWRDTGALSDAELTKLIRDDQIDILVDLTLHLARNRLSVFAEKPAPVQVTFAGYPGTTGLSTIDYRITDPYLDPPMMFDAFYSEKSVRLPQTFWCDEFSSGLPTVGLLPAIANGFVTFGSLNNFCKINLGVMDQWADVLSRVSNSRLLLLAPASNARHAFTVKMGDRGIDASRIEFVAKQSRNEYLNTYNRIDLILDTLPYNGHATSFDALSMGVPVVTQIGDTVVGRAGLSLLTSVGLPDLVARSHQEYATIAVNLANDLSRLASIRSTLRNRIKASPLGDIQAFARAIEAAYCGMWTGNLPTD